MEKFTDATPPGARVVPAVGRLGGYLLGAVIGVAAYDAMIGPWLFGPQRPSPVGVLPRAACVCVFFLVFYEWRMSWIRGLVTFVLLIIAVKVGVGAVEPVPSREPAVAKALPAANDAGSMIAATGRNSRKAIGAMGRAGRAIEEEDADARP